MSGARARTPGSGPPRRVAVVGAGLAGLSAAWSLTRRGIAVEVFERASEPGGRFGGRWEEGFSIEGSLALLPAADHPVLEWIAAEGLAGELMPIRRVALAQVHQGRVRTVDPRTLYGIMRTPGLRWRDAPRTLRLSRLMRRYRPLLDVAHPERAARWDDRSVADFARLYFGVSSLARWIGPEVTAAMPGDATQISRVAFLLQRGQRGMAEMPPGLPSQPLHQLAQIMSQGLRVRFAEAVEAVEASGAGGFVIRCRNAVGRRESVGVEAVILATSAPASARIAAGILTGPEREFLSGIRCTSALTLSMAVNREFGGAPLFVRVPQVEGLPIAAILIVPGGDSRAAPDGCAVVRVSATGRVARRHRSSADEVVEKELRGAVERLFPALGPALSFTRLTRSDETVPSFPVGAYRALDRFRRVLDDRRALGRRLYFAGEYLIGPGPEGALLSGLRAAGELCDEIG